MSFCFKWLNHVSQKLSSLCAPLFVHGKDKCSEHLSIAHVNKPRLTILAFDNCKQIKLPVDPESVLFLESKTISPSSLGTLIKIKLKVWPKQQPRVFRRNSLCKLSRLPLNICVLGIFLHWEFFCISFLEGPTFSIHSFLAMYWHLLFIIFFGKICVNFHIMKAKLAASLP